MGNKKGFCLTADRLLIVLLACWWVANLLQAAFTELANDEAYYYMFSQNLAWGYFDHPPMTSLLVRMGAIFGGELGVRFFFTLLQPLYLIILWYLVKPDSAQRTDAKLFVVVAAAIPMLQLYGFIAVPDAPLLFFSAIFLLFYKRFTDKQTLTNALLLGVSMAALAYSKYHGALVVIFTLASNVRLLKNPKLYIAAATAALLIVPHLMWQHQHDWASMRYHLAGRNKSFKIEYVVEYILNIFAVFNPLFFPTYVKAWITSRSRSLTERAIYFISMGMILFFLLSSIRGYVQPQWIIPASFGFVALLFSYARVHARTQRYVFRAGIVTIILFVGLRFVMIFNPIGLRFEIFDNKASYEALAELAQGRTLIMGGNYTSPAKYNFYTGGKACSQPAINYRTSQWQFESVDRNAIGERVLIEVGDAYADTTITLANGRTLSFREVADFRPVREVAIEHDRLPRSVVAGQKLNIELTIKNPYDYPITISPDSVNISMVWGEREKSFNEYVTPIEQTIPPHSQAEVSLSFIVPNDLQRGDYRVGYVVRAPYMGYWFADRQTKIEIK